MRLLTAKQVAAMMQMSPAWVRDHATRKRPLIPSVKFGDKRSKAARRFREEDVKLFVATYMVNGL
jgi:hypothetical protein